MHANNNYDFNEIAKTDNIITGLYQIIPAPPVIGRPSLGAKFNKYFINNPTPSINNNVIKVYTYSLIGGNIRVPGNTYYGDINENWGKITDITYNQIYNTDIIPLLYNEYDNGLSNDDKQLLIDTIKILKSGDDIGDGGLIE